MSSQAGSGVPIGLVVSFYLHPRPDGRRESIYTQGLPRSRVFVPIDVTTPVSVRWGTRFPSPSVACLSRSGTHTARVQPNRGPPRPLALSAGTATLYTGHETSRLGWL